MIWIIIILILIVLVCFYLLYSNRNTTIDITEQLKLALHKNELFDIKVTNSNKNQNELIKQINILNTSWRQMYAENYQRSLQQKEMISSITHDFRTPLTSMLGYVQILQETLDIPTKIKYLNIIEERTLALTKLVDDFYEISILDSEEYPLCFQKIDPKIILQNTLALYYEDITTTFSNTIIDISEDISLVKIDSNALNRIYSNLIKNALTHGFDTFKVSSSIQHDKLIILFSNTIKNKQQINLDKLFNRTYRSDTTRNINSTGLGLSIAKELSNLMNIELDVTMEKDIIIFKLSFHIQ